MVEHGIHSRVELDGVIGIRGEVDSQNPWFVPDSQFFPLSTLLVNTHRKGEFAPPSLPSQERTPALL